MNEPNKQAPVFSAETPERWQAVHDAAAAGDETGLKNLLVEMELSPRLARAFIAAIAEERELSDIIARREAAQAEVDTIRGAAAFAPPAPKNAKEAVAIVASQRGAMARAVDCERALSVAAAADRYLRWLHLFLSEFFGKPLPLTAAYLLAGPIESPKTGDELRAAGVSDAALYTPGGWRAVGQQDSQDKPRRRYTSFSPVAPRR